MAISGNPGQYCASAGITDDSLLGLSRLPCLEREELLTNGIVYELGLLQCCCD